MYYLQVGHSYNSYYYHHQQPVTPYSPRVLGLMTLRAWGCLLPVITCIPRVFTIPLSRGGGPGMSIQENQENELLDVLYSAVGEPALWNEFLARVTGHLDARMAAFLSVDPGSQRSSVHLHAGWPSDALRQYEAYYGAIDSWYLGYKNKNLRSWTGTGSSLCLPSELKKSEFYNDFLRLHDTYHQCGLILENGRGKVLALSAVRSQQQVKFDTSHVQFMERLAPHLTGAMHLHRKMLDLKHAASVTAGVLDTLDVALIGLDADGRVCFANGLAESLLRSAEVLRIHDGRIVAQDSREAAALDRLLNAASALDMSTGAAGALTVHKGDRLLHLTVVPFRASAHFFPERLKVFLTITDPDAAPKSRAQLLTKLFRLTPAETRVAMLLVAGMELNEIATRTRTTSHTVRSHLKSIYHKTGATRQSQLMRLISRLPGQP